MKLLVTAVPTETLKALEQGLAAHRDRCQKLAINLSETAANLTPATEFEKILAQSCISLAESEAIAFAGMLEALRNAIDACPVQEFEL
ncbi:MAG: hypothetical protein K1X67_07860 [Fimbriimonadaceae bacterium]|nr:hypothetical protein [Fimbriimonadaceae bacterium]